MSLFYCTLTQRVGEQNVSPELFALWRIFFWQLSQPFQPFHAQELADFVVSFFAPFTFFFDIKGFTIGQEGVDAIDATEYFWFICQAYETKQDIYH